MGTYKHRNPITEIGDYSILVPFHREWFVAEATLNSDDVLSPLVGTEAAIAGKFPIPGATTIYRLIGNGVNEPTFDPLFLQTTGYGYDKTQGAVNVITFTYDGSKFFYNILRETPVPVDPLIGKDEWVGDFGYGPGIIAAVTIANNNLYAGDILPGEVLGQGKLRVTAFDLIRSVHYTGTGTLIYSMSKNGGLPVESADARQAYVEFDCMDVNLQTTVSLVIDDNDLLSSMQYDFQIVVSDTNLVCGPL